MRLAALVGSLLLASPALARPADGIPVAVQVVDASGAPIPTAVVRHPAEKDRHRVNTQTGTWTGDSAYLEDGTELLFTKDLELSFEVSAPGYKNAQANYVVKKRKNHIVVTLDKLEIQLEPDADDSGPVIGFKHDKPRD